MPTLADSAIVDRLRKVRLPAIPQVLAKLLELCRQENAGLPELAALIRQDPGLTVRVLEVATSEMYRRGRGALNLEQSLMAIGTNMVKTILISEAVFQAFGPLGQSGGIDLKHFWAHSLSAAVSSREIAVLTGYPRADEAYLAGLLHDVGRLALLAAAPAEYGDHFHLPDDDALVCDESATFGVTHTEAGAWVAEQWRVDSFIADAIRYHHEHETALASTHVLLRIVALAHQMSSRSRADARVLAAAALCGMGAEQVERVAQRTRADVEKLARHVGIDAAALDAAPPRLPPVLAAPDVAQAAIQNQMRDMALSQELARCFEGLDRTMSLPEAVARAASVLFGFNRAAVLRLDKHDRALRCVSASEDDQRLSEFTLPVAAAGRLTDALARRQVTFVAPSDRGRSIFEDQLSRLFGGGHLVTVPVVNGDSYYGVLIGSADTTVALSLTARGEVLRVFGEHAARVLRDREPPPPAAAPGAAGADSERLRQTLQAARELAHEVNNPLSVIRNYLSVLDRKIAKQQPVADEIAILQEEIDRVSGLVDGFSDIGADRATASAPLGAAVSAVVTMLRESETVPKAVRLWASEIDPALHIACEPGALRQILLNLVKNAVESMTGQGSVGIVSEGFTSRDGKLYLSVTVTDDGPGIPPEVLARLFQPVATTKGGAHRGLGLSIVHGLITKMHGQIYCRSSIEGTSFQLLLPLSPLSGAGATARAGTAA